MMGTRTFYLASSRDRIDDVNSIAALLVERGMYNAFAWPEHFTHRCSAETCGIRDRADLARRELTAAGTCDLFVGIARMGKGTHAELGAALFASHHTNAKRVILVGVDRSDSVFYDAAGVEHAADVPALIAMLWPRALPFDNGCAHAVAGRGRDAPLRYGSHRTEVCRACGAFRTHGHDAARSNLSDWRAASEYADATADREED
jgi:hypothetical protein